MRLDIIADSVDAALEAKRQSVASGIDRIHDLLQPVTGKSDDVQDRAEILSIQITYRVDLIESGRNEAAVLRFLWRIQPADPLRILVEPIEVLIEDLFRGLIDDRAYVRGKVGWIADLQGLHRTRDHPDHRVGDILLDEQHPQGGTTLAGTLERRGNDVASH